MSKPVNAPNQVAQLGDHRARRHHSRPDPDVVFWQWFPAAVEALDAEAKAKAKELARRQP
ncbi:hypothetical protein [Streptomyces sp. NPDC052496]|uniref:hypothetical protein n=1 Tax=Streptomyces sp. NPDC052496 TaxID=3154951 RepID=UPI003448C123